MRAGSNERLRTLLGEMTKGRQVEKHPEKLEVIRRLEPHTIRVLPTPQDEPLGEFNCVMHALGLIGLVKPPCSPVFHRYYADLIFLRALIDSSKLQSCEEQTDALVVWSSDKGMEHVGLVAAPGRAASKWGAGYLYEHELLEVPSLYGDQLAFYASIGSDAALEYLKQYYRAGRKM